MAYITNKRIRSHNIQSGHTENSFRGEDFVFFEYLASDRNGRVDRVGDDADERLGARLSDGGGQVGYDGGVHVEEVISGHARFAWHASRDHHHVAAF